MGFPLERKKIVPKDLDLPLSLLGDSELTSAERRICRYLMREAIFGYDRVIPIEELYKNIWETDVFTPFAGGRFRNHINNIRKKLDRKKGEARYIMGPHDSSHYVKGYRILIDPKGEEERYEPYRGGILEPDETEGVVLTTGGELWIYLEDSERITIPGFVQVRYDIMDILCCHYGYPLSNRMLSKEVSNSMASIRVTIKNIRNLLEEFNVSRYLIKNKQGEGYWLNCRYAQSGLNLEEPFTTEQELKLAV